MNKFDYLNKISPNGLNILIKVEQKNTQLITTDHKFKIFHKIIEAFNYLFTDDIERTINTKNILPLFDSNDSLNPNSIILIYGEIIKKFRSSHSLSLNGYIFDSVSILRASFELNLMVLAIRKKLITLHDAFSCKLTLEQEKLDRVGKQKIFNKHRQKIDHIISKYLMDTISEDIKEDFNIFKNVLNSSIHRSVTNLTINIKNIDERNQLENIFLPDINLNYYSLFLNYSCILMLMTIKNLLAEDFIKSDNLEKLKYLEKLIQETYESEPDNSQFNNLTKLIVHKF